MTLLSISFLVLPSFAAASHSNIYYEIPFEYKESVYYVFPYFVIFDPLGSSSYVNFTLWGSKSFFYPNGNSVTISNADMFTTCKDSQHQGSEGDSIIGALFKINVKWTGRLIVPKFGHRPYRVIDDIFTNVVYYGLILSYRYQFPSEKIVLMVNNQMETYYIDQAKLKSLDLNNNVGAYEYPESNNLLFKNMTYIIPFTKQISQYKSINVHIHFKLMPSLKNIPETEIDEYTSITPPITMFQKMIYTIHIHGDSKAMFFKLESNYPFETKSAPSDWMIWFKYYNESNMEILKT